MTRKSFRSIADYHANDRSVVARSIEWTGVRAVVLTEGPDDLTFNRTERHGLVMTLDGTARHLTRMDGIEDATPSQPGETSVIPAGLSVHLAWTNHAPLQRSLMVEFDDLLFRTFTPEIATDPFLRGHAVPSNYTSRPALGGLIRLLAEEADPQTARGQLYVDSALRLLALEVATTIWSVPVPRVPAGPRADARIGQAIAYIEALHTRNIGITDIAAAAGLSPTQLTRGFRAALGVSPYAYVIDRRLETAVGLLQRTDLPIAIIALEAGFADQAHLTRLMRARIGITPRAVRLAGSLRIPRKR